MHACKTCKYYYETTGNKSRQVYNALTDAVETISVRYKAPCCGYSPGGAILDDEQPKCANYEPHKV